ncbi:HAEPLYID family protein [Pedobacter sp. SYSU D00535]|uniref:HAEPLYID family protein n=1 Tax=Pedobacter sp. SYSU D00535 TaxID=2810308 RepID=UPI001A96BE46|nr:HAEPLYID family protein [Pedobacter sp. SYSU D00535]
MKKIRIIVYLLSLFPLIVAGQETEKKIKIEHAEPLYIDLIRDLGATKGEKEWNFGFGLTDNKTYDSYEALVEYEFAPADRLGLEIELPFTVFSINGRENMGSRPATRLESLKTAIQWTFLVSEKHRSSFALGYINELTLADLNRWSHSALVTGNVFNPFLVAAKRLGGNFHSLLYTGPKMERSFAKNSWHLEYEANTSFHYMVPESRNFVGLELNKSLGQKEFGFVARPQLRVSIADNLLIGIVTGIPIKSNHERLSSFMRLIWEPGHKH